MGEGTSYITTQGGGESTTLSPKDTGYLKRGRGEDVKILDIYERTYLYSEMYVSRNKRGAYRKRNHKKAVDSKYYIQRQSYSEEEGNIPQIL